MVNHLILCPTKRLTLINFVSFGMHLLAQNGLRSEIVYQIILGVLFLPYQIHFHVHVGYYQTIKFLLYDFKFTSVPLQSSQFRSYGQMHVEVNVGYYQTISTNLVSYPLCVLLAPSGVIIYGLSNIVFSAIYLNICIFVRLIL